MASDEEIKRRIQKLYYRLDLHKAESFPAAVRTIEVVAKAGVIDPEEKAALLRIIREELHK